MKYFAHSLVNEPIENWQLLKEHLKNVAEKTAAFTKKFGVEDWGRMVGLLHDVGKSSEAFQEYLSLGADSQSSENLPKTDHSTAGAQYAVNKEGILGFLLAYIVSGHHSGLLDGISDYSSLEKRLQKQVQKWDKKLVTNQNVKLKVPKYLSSHFSNQAGFYIALFTRMLYSSLVDADFLDTEQFMDYYKSGLRNKTDIGILGKMQKSFEAYIGEIASDKGIVNQERQKVLSACCSAAEEFPGLFSLTVPTGGGKTLSSLAFALRHAIKYGKDRIIYVIPFTSIIEQNAAVFRTVFSSLVEDVVLEHHSNFEQEKETTKSRLAAENWNAPLVVTTSVQFYESFFANKSSKCRKLHNIANSVIILDEAQTLPVDFLKPCLTVLDELVKSYNSTLVLCTATQPEIKKTKKFPIGLDNIREIIPDRETLHLNLRRVESDYIGMQADNELIERMDREKQVLCIVNTRNHAKLLYDELKNQENVFHLSALMCPAHRTEVLSRVKRMLGRSKPCKLVSTQLIEAGVDIDFPVVYRSLAGIDSIAQAAGRCNREGKLKVGRFYIFKSEHTRSESFFSETANSASQVIEIFDEPLTLQAVEKFFELYYWDQKSKWDSTQIFSEFRLNQNKNMPFLFNFRTVAQKFKIIDNNYESIIIPWGEKGRQLCEHVRKEFPTREFSRKLQRFTVSVNKWLWEKNLDRVFTVEQEQYPILISPELNYSEKTGLNLNENENNVFLA